MNRALVFDLDGTLYTERRYAISGFAAVARHVQSVHGVPSRRVFQILTNALRRGRRQEAFQAVCLTFGLEESRVPEWVGVYRAHTPSLRLPDETLRVLVAVRPTWRIGVLTNGVPGVQARKVAALRLESLVDAVVLAEEHGTGCGKPDPRAFGAVLERLGVPASRAVFAGDDPVRDIQGARMAGMRAIQVCRGRAMRGSEPADAGGADAVVWSLADVPAIAGALLVGEGSHVR